MKFKRLTSALVAGSLAFLLAGCYKVDVEYEFQEDATVSGEMIVGMDKTVYQQFAGMSDEMGGEDSSDGMDEFFDDADLPKDAKVEKWEDDKYAGQKATFKDVSLEELLDSDGNDDMTVKLEDGKYHMTLRNLEGLMGDDSGMGSDEEMEEIFSLYGEPSISFKFSFPGDITKHTGPGTVKGNTLTLDLKDFSAGKDVSVEADATSSSSSAVLMVVVGAVAILLLLGAGAVIVTRSRKSTDVPTEHPMGPDSTLL